MTIRRRLTIWYAATLAVLLVVVGGVIWLQYGRTLRSTLDQEVRARAEDVRQALESSTGASPETTDPAWLGIFAAVFRSNGSLAGASHDTPAGLALPPIGARTENVGPSGAAYAIVAVAGPDGTVIVAGRPLALFDRSLADLAWLMALAGLLAVAVSVGGGWWLAGRALRPVDGMVAEANAIGMADLGRRLRVPPTEDEMSRLARTLNDLLERVSGGVRRERFFVAAASHDLRTPIAALQTELELAARHERDPDALLGSIRAAHADTVHLSSLAANLLRLAEAEPGGRELLREPVSLRELLDGVVARFAPLAAVRDVSIRVTAPAVSVIVDRLRLEQAVGNLLSNAVLESAGGSEVEVDARTEQTSRHGLELRVEVLDRGPGVSAAIRDRLFEPFGKGSAREGRTGLGLATAFAAARAHDGTISYQDRIGGGASFTISLPLRA